MKGGSSRPAIRLSVAVSITCLLACRFAHGDDGTWIANPVNNDWNTPANWSSNTVPGPFDTATFAVSNTTNISIPVPNAGSATLHNLGGTVSGATGGGVSFSFHTNAAESTILNEGGQVSGAQGGSTIFQGNNPSAANATIIANGGAVSGAGGGLISFNDSSLAGNATLIANGGVNGGVGGSIIFLRTTDGGTARVELFGNGNLDLGQHFSQPPMTFGSLEGDGVVFLSQRSLMIGGNGLSTIFSGVINGNGSLVKTGPGTLTLSGVNLYLDGTTVAEGVMRVSNTTGSATGTGPVNVNAGTLGGSGIIAGAVTVGTGSGSGAFLTPGVGTNRQFTLTIQSALTVNSDATYTYTFKGNRDRVRSDLVIAKWVTINDGTIVISSSSQSRIRRGTVLNVISNTNAKPINGTFSNLPDGGIVNVNGTNLQASYGGGDGNDLILTVVP